MVFFAPERIGFRRLNEKSRLACQRQQIVISADEELGPNALGQIKKRLILLVPTGLWASRHLFDDLAVRHIVSQKLSPVFQRAPKLRLAALSLTGCDCVVANQVQRCNQGIGRIVGE